MPQPRQSRSRSTRKSELYDYTKENYPVEEVVVDEEYTISRNPSDASSTGRSTTRRNACRTPARNRNNSLFMGYRQPASRSGGESEDDGFNSLDDFIASDNDQPSSHEASGGESEKEETRKAPSPPRVKRRLVKGRRPNPEAEIKRALETSAHSILRLEPSLPAAFSIPSPDKEASPRKLFRDTSNVEEKMNSLDLEVDEAQVEDEIEDDDDPSSQLQQDLNK
jgi:hypothetical protein